MSEIVLHIPTGSLYHQAAAWELVVASIILFGMVLFNGKKLYNNETISVSGGIKDFFSGIMSKDKLAHLCLYIVLFALVFSAAMSFFIN